ncbi:ferredoxin [bacterium]|nr:ferredoxin [bacterium]
MMSMNEKKILFAFGCPNRDLTVERLLHATALAVDPTAKNEFFILAVKLSDEEITDWYHNFYYNMHLDYASGFGAYASPQVSTR